MTDSENKQLEQSLKDLSWWQGPTPRLWKKALNSTADPSKPSRIHRFLRSPWPWVGVPIAAVLAVAIVSTSARRVMLSNEVSEPQAIRTAHSGMASSANLGGHADGGLVFRESPAPATPGENAANQMNRFVAEIGAAGDEPGLPERVIAQLRESQDGNDGVRVWRKIGTTQKSSDSPRVYERHVVRKASIDLETDDIRSVYLKVLRIIPNEALGEYVESSEIHGSVPSEGTAYITLRVTADRLDDVLGDLRELGKVINEQITASDVTSQVVDLEARLRNERRVEQELLALMDKREDAPLKDILTLNDSLSQVRERIEKLVAQQQRIGRQVALATIVLSIHGTGAVKPDEAEGFPGKLWHNLSNAWDDGSGFLAESVAALVRILIGGLVWWVLLCVLIYLTRRWYLRRTAENV